MRRPVGGRSGGGSFVRFEHVCLRLVSDCKDVFAGGAISVRRLCSCRRRRPASPPWLVAIAGLSFGLSVDTRAYVVGLAPIFLWWIFHHSETGHGIARILWFLGGFAVGIGPSLYLFPASPICSCSTIWEPRHTLECGPDRRWKQKIGIARTLLFGAIQRRSVQHAVGRVFDNNSCNADARGTHCWLS